MKKRITERKVRNTLVNRLSMRARFRQWCEKEGRITQPTTMTAYVAACFGHLIETGSAGRM
ncbi:hypothetical protein ACH4NF_34345 [Streptomyces sp. NPDC017248]|uniref:hypothetical protein n=1 Tax=unclassified Streptomyces TaxID=2593676 RepID=UPI00378E2473